MGEELRIMGLFDKKVPVTQVGTVKEIRKNGNDRYVVVERSDGREETYKADWDTSSQNIVIDSGIITEETDFWGRKVKR